MAKNLEVLAQGAAAAAAILLTAICNSVMSPATAEAAERHPHLLDPMSEPTTWSGALRVNVPG